MSQTRLSSKLLAGIILTLFFGLALYLRIYLPYDQVFTGEGIKFTSVDAYYHMRLVDNLLQHFPQRITFDPYTIYPHGHIVNWPPFFDWLLAGTIWLFGLGSPSQHTIDVVGVYFPAVLGAVTVIPVYFIGKELFNRWAGVLSAGLIALQPGEFLFRSTLGFTDHHVAEALFTTVTILFLILAIKSARQRQLAFKHLKCGDWAIISKPALYSLLAGTSLGIYLFTWVGGLLFVFLIFIYFIIQFIINHLRGESTDYLGIVGTLSMLITLIISLFLPPQALWLSRLYLPSFIIVTLTLLTLTGISHLLTNRKIKPVYYPLTVIVLGLAGVAVFHIINASLLKSILSRLSIFTPAGATGQTIMEMQPLLFSAGNFSLSIAWGYFTTGFFLSFVALGILIYIIVKQGSADKVLLVVWSLFMLTATLAQRRFGYYLAVNVALLTGYLSWRILEFTGFEKMIAKPVETPRMTKKKKAKLKKMPRAAGVTTSHISAALVMVVVFFLVFFPNIGKATATASGARFAPSDAWCSSLSWLKENSPDPFNNPDFYYELYESPPPGKGYKYPESAYGVMAWWDYGHWITRIAHRIPNVSPSQKPQAITSVASFFTSQDESSANEIPQELDSSYIIIDYETAIGMFWAIALWAGKERTEYSDVYYVPQENRFVPVQLFHPEYYRSLSTRLYNFDGKAVTPESTVVISYQERVSQEGKLYKRITSMEEFSSYEEAETYLLSQESDDYKMVGANPFITPVPLDALKHYKLIHSSDSGIIQPSGEFIPSVKIFEYIE